MDSDEIVARRISDAVRKCILAACMKVPKAPKTTIAETREKIRQFLSSMDKPSVSDVQLIEDTEEEKLVREIMEEEEDEINVRMTLTPQHPVKYLKCKLKI